MIYKNLVFLVISTLATLHHAQANDDAVCKSQLTPGDLDRGLSAIADFACMSADGCFRVNSNTNCRYCKIDASVESEYQVCQTLQNEIEQGRRTCEQSISIGDRKSGLIAFYDPMCTDPLADGLGCFDSCRLCQERGRTPTPYYRCDALPTVAPTVAPTTTQAASQAADESSQGNDEPTSTQAPSQATDEPTSTEEDDSQGSDIDLACNQKLSEEEKASGIGAFKDLACQSGDSSCFDDICRYCKVFGSPVSAQHAACKSNACSVNVSEGDRAVGISAFLDKSCLQGSKTGCWAPDSTCRYCKVFNTPASIRFVNCYDQPSSSGSESERV